jgi:hypothetical protein
MLGWHGVEALATVTLDSTSVLASPIFGSGLAGALMQQSRTKRTISQY